MSYTGKILTVSKGRVTIGSIKPKISDYMRQIPGVDMGALDLGKGDAIQFDFNIKKSNATNLKLLRKNPTTPSAGRRSRTGQLSQQTAEPIEYCAYIANVIEESNIANYTSEYIQKLVRNKSDKIYTDFIEAYDGNSRNWAYLNAAFAIHHALSCNTCKHTPEDVKNVWQLWVLGKSRQEIGLRKNSLNVEAGNLYRIVTRPEFHLDLLPKPSFAISFRFTLAKPYISSGEESVYVIDNPVVKDSVLGLPMIRETAWKGHLRQTMREVQNRFPEDGGEVIDEKIIDRLFGPRDVDQKKARQGYLHFYPTFFNNISLEVINPHIRKTRAGDKPIFIESVPVGCQGDFLLLYTPVVGLAHITDSLSENDRQKWVECNNTIMEKAQIDLQQLACAIRAMFLEYGFSAKATDGYGRARNMIENIGSIPMFQTNCAEIAPYFEWDSDANGVFAVNQFQTFDAFAQSIREIP